MSVDSTIAQTTLWAIRGGISVGPENTIEGMGLTFDLGARGTEIDLWNTAPDSVTGAKGNRRSYMTERLIGRLMELDRYKTCPSNTFAHSTRGHMSILTLTQFPFPELQFPL